MVGVRAVGCRPVAATRAVGVTVADGLILTVAHAVAGESGIVVTTPDGRTLGATVVALDAALDAAVLFVDGLGLPAVGRGEPVTGPARVVLLPELDVVVEPAEILRRVEVMTSDIYGEGRHARAGLELAADVQPGESGGVVVTPDGSAVAMVWATSRDRDDRAWATDLAALAPLIDAAVAGRVDPPAACSR